MSLSQKIFDEISIKGSDVITTKQLMEFGLFTSSGQAGAIRDRGEGPPFRRNWNGSIIYYKIEVLKWLKENDTSTIFRNDTSTIFRKTVTPISSFQKSRSKCLNLSISQELLSKLIAESQLEDKFITTNRWVADFLEKAFADKPAPKEKSEQRALEDAHPSPKEPSNLTESKFLTIKLFLEKFPSFRRSFFRRMLRDRPAFVKKVMRKNGASYFVNVEAFWKFLDEDSNFFPQGD